MAERTLEERRGDLEKRELEQAQFVADVSHELRTPLTILRGGIEVVLDGERTADEYRQALSEALVEVQHLIRISENLLFLARGAAGHVTLTFSRVELTRFAAETLREFEAAAHEKGLTLELHAIEPPLTILGDKNRLRQVFHNILENAIRYTDQGRVSVSISRGEAGALLVFKDTGVGIEESDLPYVFDRFFRSDRARRAYRGGSGLGLSIVRWIVEIHKGSIRVESELGRGTTISIRFPAID